MRSHKTNTNSSSDLTAGQMKLRQGQHVTAVANDSCHGGFSFARSLYFAITLYEEDMKQCLGILGLLRVYHRESVKFKTVLLVYVKHVNMTTFYTHSPCKRR